MFVKQSTYDKLEDKYKNMTSTASHYQSKYLALLMEWNSTVEKINMRTGSWEFIETGVIPQGATQLSQDDIRSLIQLVHPDKHEGKESAVRLTQVLLKLRK